LPAPMGEGEAKRGPKGVGAPRILPKRHDGIPAPAAAGSWARDRRRKNTYGRLSNGDAMGVVQWALSVGRGSRMRASACASRRGC
jgi:hypothetical protein